jgi:hypothetical protein
MPANITRSVRADAIDDGMLFLFKNATTLRLTYQIRLLVFQAMKMNSRLIIIIPNDCFISNSLDQFVKQYPMHVRIHRG